MVGNSSVYNHLKHKWTKKRQSLHKQLFENHTDIASSHKLKTHLIAGLIFASAPFLLPAHASADQPIPVPTPVQSQSLNRDQLSEILKKNLPDTVRPLTPDEEATLSGILSASYHVNAKPELNGIRLNRSYGYIGQEQHLKRYPGDSLETHFDTAENASLYADKGMAPGLGAWGYFAYSQSSLTQEDIDREKYYIAVQTFLAPGWNQHVGEYGLFFKYRKMLIVNPDNGKAMIVDIADAGPGESTGKHLGGSPEVMRYLERVDGAQKGPVLYFFVDESSGILPLGPIQL